MRIQYQIVFLAWTAVACAQQNQRLSLPQEAAINLPTQPIGASDLLTVNIYNQPSLSRTVRVSGEGLIRLPMLKKQLNVAGMLLGTLEEAIAQAYVEEGILISPQVTVNIAEYHSHPIQVGGSVKKPVTFQAEAPITLLEAINKAEGLSDVAGSEILVTKKGEPTRRVTVKALFEAKDESANVVLTGGEEVRIPEAGRVFVIGNVKKPCQYPLKQGESTVMQALAYSEGLLRYSTKQAFIYRREANGSKNEIPIELQKIMKREAPDVALLADDILYVPENEKKRMSMTALATLAAVGGGAAVALVYTHR